MLDKFSTKILKFINGNLSVDLKTLNEKFRQDCSESIDFLIEEKFIVFTACGTYIDYSEDEPCYVLNYQYNITPAGLAYLQSLTKERLKYWVPIILADLLSIAALIVSILK